MMDMVDASISREAIKRKGCSLENAHGALVRVTASASHRLPDGGTAWPPTVTKSSCAFASAMKCAVGSTMSSTGSARKPAFRTFVTKARMSLMKAGGARVLLGGTAADQAYGEPKVFAGEL